MDGGELAPDGAVVDDLPQCGSQLVTGRLSVQQYIIHGELALVALGRAAGAELEDLGQNVTRYYLVFIYIPSKNMFVTL